MNCSGDVSPRSPPDGTTKFGAPSPLAVALGPETSILDAPPPVARPGLGCSTIAPVTDPPPAEAVGGSAAASFVPAPSLNSEAVFSHTSQLGSIPFAIWNALNASRVAGPKNFRSTSDAGKLSPCDSNNSCTPATSSPTSPTESIFFIIHLLKLESLLACFDDCDC